MNINIELAVEKARDAGDAVGVELTRSDITVLLTAAVDEIARQAIIEQFKAIIRATNNVLARTEDPLALVATEFHLNLMEQYLKVVKDNGPTVA